MVFLQKAGTWIRSEAMAFVTGSGLAAAFVLFAQAAVAAPPAPAPGKGAGKPEGKTAVVPDGEANPSERRAVRGAPVSGGDESPELRELRRFQDQAFGRSSGEPVPALDPERAPSPLPLGLGGRWGGTGDIPPELRSPAQGAHAGRVPPTPDSEELRNLKLPELPVRWEPVLLRYLEYFGKDPKGRAFVTASVRRMGRFRALFDRVLEGRGVPKDLVYLAMIESGFEPSATSTKNAGGVWQFMPEVARAYGLEVSYWVDARRDPERAVEAAARLFEDLHHRFGSWPLAFAAYHAGYGAILRSITRYNTNDYWELCKHEAGLPWETTLYVPKILAVAIIGHNLDAFGFGAVVSDAPLAYDTIEVPAGTALATVARAVASRPEAIAALNPEFVRARTPPDRGVARVRVPVGTAAQADLAGDRSRSAADKVESYVMRFGESLDDIARARGTSARELRRLNGLKFTAELRGGTTIVVPVRGDAPAPSRVKEPAAGDVDDTVLVAVPDRVFSYQDRERVFYRTRDGDSVDELAGVFGVTADELCEWNNLDADAKLHSNMVCQVFVLKDFDRAGVALLDPAKVRVATLGSEDFLELEAARRGKTRLTYAARAGDTLAKIARRYGLAPGDLARINRLSYNSDLEEGQKVVVYSPTPELPRELTLGRTVPRKRPGDPSSGAARLTAPQPARPTTKVAVRGAVGTKPVLVPSAASKPGLASKPAIAAKPTLAARAVVVTKSGVAKAAVGAKPTVAGKPAGTPKASPGGKH